MDRPPKSRPANKEIANETQNKSNNQDYLSNSKKSMQSQNKPFIRKPSVKRLSFASPSFSKMQSRPCQQKSRDSIKKNRIIKLDSDSRSDRDIKQNSCLRRDFKEKTSNGHMYESNRIYNNSAVNEEYFGETDTYTEIARSKKKIIEIVSSDNSQQDVDFRQKPKFTENMVANRIHKKTRTQYFKQQDITSSNSRSHKNHQIDFSQLKREHNPEYYIDALQNTIKNLQKSNYTLHKKCKWMHEQVQMHLEKENLFLGEKEGYKNEIKDKQNQIKELIEEKEIYLKELNGLKLDKTRKDSLKNSTDSETFQEVHQEIKNNKNRSLKNKIHEVLNQIYHPSYDLNQNYCSSKIKMEFQLQQSNLLESSLSQIAELQQISKHSSIENKEKECKQLSLNQKQKQYQESYEQERVKNQILSEQKCNQIQEKHTDQLQLLSVQIQTLKISNLAQISQYIKQISQLQQKNQTLQKALMTSKQEVQKLQKQLFISRQETQQIRNLQQKKIFHIQQQFSIQTQVDLQMFKNRQPFDDNQNQNYLKSSQCFMSQEDEIVKLRQHIRNLLQSFKYIKIQNRMLLKIKQDFQQCLKQKNQLKQERDMFKKRVLEMIKKDQNNFSKIKHKVSLDDSQQSGHSSLLQLSSEINTDSNLFFNEIE